MVELTNWQFLFWLLAMWLCGYETRRNWARDRRSKGGQND